MSSNLDLSRIGNLTNQSNYADWALEVEATARLGGFWKAYSGNNKTTSTTPDATETDRVETREEKAVGLLLKTVSPNLRVELKALTASQTVPVSQQYWDHLKGKYEKQDGASSLLDFAALVETKLVDDGTLEAQLNALEATRSRCVLNKIKLEDWQYAALLLLHLPENYKHISDSFLTNNDIDKLVPATVTAKIIETEIRRKADSSSSANMVHGSGNGPKRKSKKPPAGQPCHYCQKEGHWAQQCRKKKADNAKANSSKKKEKPGSNSLNVVEHSDAESETPVYAYFGSPESWLVDSGATDHMSPYGPDFTDYVKYAETRNDNTVVLGDGTTRLRIRGKGTIKRWVETAPHAYRLLILEDVLHVKGIKRRFISASRFDQRGFTTTIGAGSLTIAKGGFKFSGSRIGTLYQCTMYAEKPLGARSLSSVEKPLPIKTWHERMGHLNWEALKSMRAVNPPLLGVKLDASSPPTSTCEGCVAGKAKRRTFKSSESRSTRSTEPIERIHSDLMGPMEPASIGGHRYACVFTCDYTGHVWTYFLKSKDQTLKTFRAFVLTIEKLTGHAIKY